MLYVGISPDRPGQLKVVRALTRKYAYFLHSCHRIVCVVSFTAQRHIPKSVPDDLYMCVCVNMDRFHLAADVQLEEVVERLPLRMTVRAISCD